MDVNSRKCTSPNKQIALILKVQDFMSSAFSWFVGHSHMVRICSYLTKLSICDGFWVYWYCLWWMTRNVFKASLLLKRHAINFPSLLIWLFHGASLLSLPALSLRYRNSAKLCFGNYFSSFIFLEAVWSRLLLDLTWKLNVMLHHPHMLQRTWITCNHPTFPPTVTTFISILETHLDMFAGLLSALN